MSLSLLVFSQGLDMRVLDSFHGVSSFGSVIFGCSYKGLEGGCKPLPDPNVMPFGGINHVEHFRRLGRVIF